MSIKADCHLHSSFSGDSQAPMPEMIDKGLALGLVHSMSRVGCCADNGLMEGFWGMLKRERYYTRKFTSR